MLWSHLGLHHQLFVSGCLADIFCGVHGISTMGKKRRNGQVLPEDVVQGRGVTRLTVGSAGRPDAYYQSWNAKPGLLRRSGPRHSYEAKKGCLCHCVDLMSAHPARRRPPIPMEKLTRIVPLEAQLQSSTRVRRVSQQKHLRLSISMAEGFNSWSHKMPWHTKVQWPPRRSIPTSAAFLDLGFLLAHYHVASRTCLAFSELTTLSYQFAVFSCDAAGSMMDSVDSTSESP